MSLGIVIHNIVVQFDNPPFHPKMADEMLSYRIFSSKKLVLTLKSNFQFFKENAEITLCIKGYQEFTLSFVSLFISLHIGNDFKMLTLLFGCNNNKLFCFDSGARCTELAGREVIVVGDGHCLLHAFAISLEDEKVTVSSVEGLCSKLKNEIEQHLSFYRPFSTNKSLIENIDSYIK